MEAVLNENYTTTTNEQKFKTGNKSLSSVNNDMVCKIEAQLGCLRRLFSSKTGFQAFTMNK